MTTATDQGRAGKDWVDLQPFFSVVIPAYNAADFIVTALDSVGKQSSTDYEIVVVDDGSEDGTYDKVRQWGAANPQIPVKIIRQKNLGIGGARNSGVRTARGKYLAFLDADDSWLQRKLEVVAQFLAEAPQTDMLCHDEWLDNGNKLKRLTYGPHTTYRDLLFRGNCISTAATVIRRQTMSEVGWFSEDLRFNSAEDYEFWLRVAKAGGRIEYLPEVLGIYRSHGQGVTGKIARHVQNSLNVLDAHFAQWHPKTLYYRYLIQKRRADAWRGGARALVKRGDSRQAGRFFSAAFKEDPLAWKTWVLSVLNLLRVRV